MKRRGFTLIELMVVIAIIIILAAIAIPNYLSMTARAKRSRVASDFAALATALETYKTDWNQYPAEAAKTSIMDTTKGGFYGEITGDATNAVTNSGTMATGETGPIVYMTSNIVTSMINPYTNDKATTDAYYFQSSKTHWLLVAETVTGSITKGALVADPDALWRSDQTTSLTDSTTTAATLPPD